MSADVPKVARVAGLGIIKLAQASGRPIYPSAIATSRRYVLNNWDRTTINLPFGRGAGVAAEPLTVPREADDAALEAARQLLEERLNAATRRAYELVDTPGAKAGAAKARAAKAEDHAAFHPAQRPPACCVRRTVRRQCRLSGCGDGEEECWEE